MEFLLLRELIVIAGSAISAYTDFKTRLILDKVTYPMIAIGLILNLYEIFLHGINFDTMLLIGIPLAVFALGYALYFMGKVGGGDIKLLAGIAMLLPIVEGAIFVLNVLFVAAMVSIIFISTYYVAKYFRKGIEIKKDFPTMLRALFYGLAIILYFSMLLQLKVMSFEKIALLGIPIFFAILFIAFENGIRKNFFLKTVKLSELEEDEVVAIDFLEKNTVKELGLKFKGVLGKNEIEKLKKMKIHEVKVYRQLPPFAPFILAGVIVSILKPDLILWFFV